MIDKEKMLNDALVLLAKPTTKTVRLAADILIRIINCEGKKICSPAKFEVSRYTPEAKGVQLKRFICAICPSCGSRTFSLNTEIMQGSCLSCSFKSNNYKHDMQTRNSYVLNKVQEAQVSDTTKAE